MNKDSKCPRKLFIVAGIWFVLAHFVVRYTLGIPIILFVLGGVYWGIKVVVSKFSNKVSYDEQWDDDMDTDNTAKCLFITAGIWFAIGSLLMGTIGSALAPTGGLDALGAAIVYAFIWRAIVIGIPIILVIIGVIKSLINRRD